MSRSTIPRFLGLVSEHGSDFMYHRDIGTAACPCRTELGSRDPELHLRWKGGIQSVSGYSGVVPPDAIPVGPSHDIRMIEYQMFMDASGVPVGPPATGSVNVSGADRDAVFIKLRPFIPENAYTMILFRKITDMANNSDGWQNLGVQPMDAYFTAELGWADNIPVDFSNPADPALVGTCNAEGYVTNAANEFTAKGFIQPVQSGAVRRLTNEQLEVMFGEVQTDDHLGIVPVHWKGRHLDFNDWPGSTAHYLTYNGRRFNVVSTNMIPDPADGNPEHHWEIGLRLISG